MQRLTTESVRWYVVFAYAIVSNVVLGLVALWFGASIVVRPLGKFVFEALAVLVWVPLALLVPYVLALHGDRTHVQRERGVSVSRLYYLSACPLVVTVPLSLTYVLRRTHAFGLSFDETR